jgi:hypothetical protein
MTPETKLARTIELIDLCFKLKEAHLRRQHPSLVGLLKKRFEIIQEKKFHRK